MLKILHDILNYNFVFLPPEFKVYFSLRHCPTKLLTKMTKSKSWSLKKKDKTRNALDAIEAANITPGRLLRVGRVLISISSSARRRIRNEHTQKETGRRQWKRTTRVDRQGRCRGLIGGGRVRRYSAWTLRDNVATAYKE